jgi:hypothetical protein
MLSIFDALRPCAIIRDGKLLTGSHLRECLITGPQPQDIELLIAPGLFPDDLVITERENLRRALFALDLRLPAGITDRRECTPVLRSAARRFKTIIDPNTKKKRAITVGDIWQMDVKEFVCRVTKNFSQPGKPVFTRPASISPSPEDYWIAQHLLKRPTSLHSCLKWYRHPLDLRFSHDVLRFGVGKVIRYSRSGKEILELAFGLATQTTCHRQHTEEEQPEAKKYLADARENRVMVAAGDPMVRRGEQLPFRPPMILTGDSL